MVIPKTFQLFGKTFKVSQPWKVDKNDSRGECNTPKCLIKIQRGLPIEEKEVVCLHEQIHAILDALEYNELSENEEFIERFSKVLHQVLTTSK